MDAKWLGYVVCDLDGCLSDDRHRRHLLPEKGKRDSYMPYHALCSRDPIVELVLGDVIYDLFDVANQAALLLIVTGRPEEYRGETEAWLRAHLGGVKWELMMRSSSHDNTPPPELKMKLMTDFFLSTHNIDDWGMIVSAYDDRADVLAAYPIADDRKHLTALPNLRFADIDQKTLEWLKKTADPRDWLDISPAPTPPWVGEKHDVPSVLRRMAETFEERAKVYGDHYKNFAKVTKALWPDGVPPGLLYEARWHLFELVLVKVCRFAATNLTHVDSIHDMAVYAAMIEADLARK